MELIVKIAVAIHRKSSIDFRHSFFIPAHGRVSRSEVGVSGWQIGTRRNSFLEIRNCILETVTANLDLAKLGS